MNYHNRMLILLCLLLLLAGCGQKELVKKEQKTLSPARLYTNPADVEIITSDVDLFWRMYEQESPLFTALELNEQYINAGTPALSLYFQEKIKSTDAYTGLLNSWIDRQYYNDIREATLQISNYKYQIIEAFTKFNKLYADAVFTDVNLVIGALNTGGIVLPNGQIVIAAEMFAKTPETDISYLSPWLQEVLRDPDYLPVIIIHELVHLQQQQFAQNNDLPAGGETLLDRALLEGSADFITGLVLNRFLNDRLLPYANPREKQLWTEFSKTMNSGDVSDWLYNGSASTKRPADLGYYIGFKVAEYYYDNATDKQHAVKDIIQIKDGQQFLKKSDYANSFNQR